MILVARLLATVGVSRWNHINASDTSPPDCERTYVEVNAAWLVGGMRRFRSQLPASSSWCAVIKANGYGLGTVTLASIVEESGVAAMICVDYASTAFELRRHGIRLPILVMYHWTPSDVCRAIASNVILSIQDAAHPKLIERGLFACADPSLTLSVHLNLDIDVMREGLLPDGISPALQRLQAIRSFEPNAPHVEICGVWMHFGCTNHGEEIVRAAAQRFDGVVAAIVAAGKLDRSRLLVHAAASSNILKVDRRYLYYDMVRTMHTVLFAGATVTDRADYQRAEPIVLPFARWVARVGAVKTWTGDWPVDYACEAPPTGESVVVLPVGHYEADRVLSGPVRATHLPSGCALTRLATSTNEVTFRANASCHRHVHVGDLVRFDASGFGWPQHVQPTVPRVRSGACGADGS